MRFTRNADLVVVARQVPTGRTRLCSDPERVKLAADRLFREAGVRVLYHTQIVDVLRSGSGRDARIDAVVVANKGGLGCIRPKVAVDCTGDGDVAAWAGAPFDLFEQPQPMSLHFRVGNVPASPALQQRCAEVCQEAHAAGRLGTYGGPWMSAFAPDEVYVNSVRLPGMGTDPEQLSAAEQRGRRGRLGPLRAVAGVPARVPRRLLRHQRPAGRGPRDPPRARHSTPSPRRTSAPPPASRTSSSSGPGPSIATRRTAAPATTPSRRSCHTTSPTAPSSPRRWRTSSSPGAATRPPRAHRVQPGDDHRHGHGPGRRRRRRPGAAPARRAAGGVRGPAAGPAPPAGRHPRGTPVASFLPLRCTLAGDPDGGPQGP